MSKVVEATEKNFNEVVIANGGITIVDFWAEWCGPCKAMGPILDKLAEDHADISVRKVNVDFNASLAQKYGIRGIPTLIFFKDGEPVETKIGLASGDSLLRTARELNSGI